MSSSFYSGNSSGNNVTAIVVDVGAGTTKMGWAGDDYPRSLFRSNIACIRDNKTHRIKKDTFQYDYYTRPIVPPNSDGEYDIYNPIDFNTGLYYHNHQSYNSNNTPDIDDIEMHDTTPTTTTTSTSTNPATSNATITNQNPPDWYDIINQFIVHGYNTGLSGNVSQPATTIEDHPVLMLERSYNPPASRQMMTEMLFEELNIPALFLGKDAVMACYGCGRTSATVIDIGYSGTTVTPVYEGFVEQKGVRRNPSASLSIVDEMILSSLDKLYYRKKKQKNTYTIMPLYQLRSKNHKMRKLSFHTAARNHMAWSCREEGAGITINTVSDSSGGVGIVMGGTSAATPSDGKSKGSSSATAFNAPSKPYELPDGTILDVPSIDRFRAADLLYGSDDLSQSKRDNHLLNVKGKVQEYISSISSRLPDNRNDDEAYQRQLARESVGIVSDTTNSNRMKRPRRGTVNDNNGNSSNNSNSNTVPSTIRPRKTTSTWERAILGPIQKLHDEQFTSASIGNMVCDSAYRCDREQQATLLGNVIVCGGGTCIGPTEQAVTDAVRDQIEYLIHQHTPGWRVKVLSPSIPERAVLSWIGGSILGSLGAFHEMWITKSEYDEWGSAIVNRKCP